MKIGPRQSKAGLSEAILQCGKAKRMLGSTFPKQFMRHQMAFWVVGGEYTGTDFKAIAPGKTLEKHGPFDDYKHAHDIWASRAWATVDDCQSRFRIVEGDAAAPGDGPSLAEGQPPAKA